MLEIALIIAKIFDHLKSPDEIILITFLTASALSLSQLEHTLWSFSLDQSENEISQATEHLPFFQ